jgi:hypothetical protein
LWTCLDVWVSRLSLGTIRDPGPPVKPNLASLGIRPWSPNRNTKAPPLGTIRDPRPSRQDQTLAIHSITTYSNMLFRPGGSQSRRCVPRGIFQDPPEHVALCAIVPAMRRRLCHLGCHVHDVSCTHPHKHRFFESRSIMALCPFFWRRVHGIFSFWAGITSDLGRNHLCFGPESRLFWAGIGFFSLRFRIDGITS